MVQIGSNRYFAYYKKIHAHLSVDFFILFFDLLAEGLSVGCAKEGRAGNQNVCAVFLADLTGGQVHTAVHFQVRRNCLCRGLVAQGTVPCATIQVQWDKTLDRGLIYCQQLHDKFFG